MILIANIYITAVKSVAFFNHHSHKKHKYFSISLFRIHILSPLKKKRVSGFETKLSLIMRIQLWRTEEWEVPLYYYYFRVQSTHYSY